LDDGARDLIPSFPLIKIQTLFVKSAFDDPDDAALLDNFRRIILFSGMYGSVFKKLNNSDCKLKKSFA
jgi:hypothetical protein